MIDADAGGALKSEAIEIIGQLPAVALARAAQDQIGQDGRQAGPVLRITRRPGRQHERHRRRLHRRHLFAEQGQAVVKRMLEKLLRQAKLRSQ